MAEKGQKLVHFLTDMGGDAAKLEKLKKDPDGVLNNYDLSGEEKDAVKKSLQTGKPDHVLEHLPEKDVAQYGNVEVNCI